MSQKKKQLVLGVFLTRHGHYPSAWRQPGSAPAGNPDFRYWASLVKTAERGKFDTAFSLISSVWPAPIHAESAGARLS